MWPSAPCSTIKLLPLTLIPLLLTGCMLSGDDQQLDDFEDEESLNEDSQGIMEIEDNPRPHPKNTSAWNTRALVMTHPLPSQDKLNACSSQLQVVAENVINQDQLLSSEQQILYEIKQNLDVYHWCFYSEMMTIDQKLRNDNMDMRFDEKNQYFLGAMKAMWILSRALDQASSEEQYFKFLQKRYIQMSNEFFARDVDILGPPLGGASAPAKSNSTLKPPGKPAAETDVDL